MSARSTRSVRTSFLFSLLSRLSRFSTLQPKWCLVRDMAVKCAQELMSRASERSPRGIFLLRELWGSGGRECCEPPNLRSCGRAIRLFYHVDTLVVSERVLIKKERQLCLCRPDWWDSTAFSLKSHIPRLNGSSCLLSGPLLTAHPWQRSLSVLWVQSLWDLAAVD